MRFVFFIFFILVLTGCFKKTENLPETKPSESKISAALRESDNKSLTQPFQILNKEQREAIYFAASLEKEALRIITKNEYSDELSLFSVLSYAVEVAAGIKKTSISRLDCSRFRFAESAKDKKLIQVFKTCMKPESLVAEIQTNDDKSHLTVTFLIKEWASVVGLSAMTTGQDVVCDLQIKNKKLDGLNCLNWIKSLAASAVSAEEIRLKTFTFQRDQESQLLVKGGLYKDLVERKKIEMRVPLQGKIKLIEKEIEVIDEFAEKPIEHNPNPAPPPVRNNDPRKSELNKLGDLIEKNSQEKNHEGQQTNQVSGGEIESGQIQNQIGEGQIPSQGNEEQSQQGQEQAVEQGEPTQEQQNQNVETTKTQRNKKRGRKILIDQNGNPIPEGRQDSQNGGIPPEGR